MFGSSFQQAVTDENALRLQQAQTGGLTGWAAITNAMSGIGSQIGYQGGQAMGGQTPAQAQQSQFQAVMDSVPNYDPSNPDSMMEMAAALNSGGFYDQGLEMFQMANKVTLDNLSVDVKKAELAALNNPTEKLLAYEKKINDVNELNISQEEKDDLITKILAGVTTTIDMGGQDKYAEKVGTGRAERDMAIIDNADLAVEGFAKTNEALEILAGGDQEVITGFGANLFLDIERFGTKFLAKKGGRVENTQYLEALLGSDVFPMIKALGIGARGLDTPAERIFLQKVMTGDITMDNAAIEKLTRLRQKYYKRAINKYNSRLDSGKFKLYEDSLSTEDYKYTLEKMQIPDAYVAPVADIIPDGAIAGTSDNGTTIYLYTDGTYHLADGTPVEIN